MVPNDPVGKLYSALLSVAGPLLAQNKQTFPSSRRVGHVPTGRIAARVPRTRQPYRGATGRVLPPLHQGSSASGFTRHIKTPYLQRRAVVCIPGALQLRGRLLPRPDLHVKGYEVHALGKDRNRPNDGEWGSGSGGVFAVAVFAAAGGSAGKVAPGVYCAAMPELQRRRPSTLDPTLPAPYAARPSRSLRCRRLHE